MCALLNHINWLNNRSICRTNLKRSWINTVYNKWVICTAGHYLAANSASGNEKMYWTNNGVLNKYQIDQKQLIGPTYSNRPVIFSPVANHINLQFKAKHHPPLSTNSCSFTLEIDQPPTITQTQSVHQVKESQ